MSNEEYKDVVVMKFHAVWCKPCKIYGRTFDMVTEKLGVAVEHIDIDQDPAMKERFHITSIPTTVVLVNGIEKRRHVGTMLNKDLTHMIQQEAAHD